MSDAAIEFLDVHYSGPIDPAREQQIADIAKQFQCSLIERKDSNPSVDACLRLGFPDYTSAGKAAVAISDAGAYVEGPFPPDDE